MNAHTAGLNAELFVLLQSLPSSCLSPTHKSINHSPTLLRVTSPHHDQVSARTGVEVPTAVSFPSERRPPLLIITSVTDPSHVHRVSLPAIHNLL